MSKIRFKGCLEDTFLSMSVMILFTTIAGLQEYVTKNNFLISQPKLCFGYSKELFQ